MDPAASASSSGPTTTPLDRQRQERFELRDQLGGLLDRRPACTADGSPAAARTESVGLIDVDRHDDDAAPDAGRVERQDGERGQPVDVVDDADHARWVSGNETTSRSSASGA